MSFFPQTTDDLGHENHVEKDTFSMFKEYADARFDTLHDCDQRLEKKLDDLMERLDKKEERHFTWRHGLTITGIATLLSWIAGKFA